jgi:hypothetical protein
MGVCPLSESRSSWPALRTEQADEKVRTEQEINASGAKSLREYRSCEPSPTRGRRTRYPFAEFLFPLGGRGQ